ncbi:ABC transporter permease [Pseudohoeflea suaedae]|uniref:ABC transporter permease n=1 Tax=Pseudohoeflea suaedae TaxID=877384 RepID=A0A4R5PP87_9HYPH|nr:ABC transporter permease [Pseudohoeflea suaedae]TDH38417.1 ABC transporter permease [Pseudohoeflea suaedae]
MKAFVRRFMSSPEGIAGALVLLLLALAAVLAPIILPGDPAAIVGRPLLPPFSDASFPLGTDQLGRDVLTRLVYGAQASLTVGLSSALVAILAGTLVGTVAGLAGGLVDEALMRVVDAFQIVPGFLLALAFVSVAGPSLAVIVLAVGLGAWTGPARLARAEVLSIRERDYVASARVIGMHPAEIAFREVLPNALPPVLSLVSVIVAAAVLIEAALSFLGLGDPNAVTWGGMIAEGRNLLRSAPFLSIIPGLGLVSAVVGIYLFGEGLVEALSIRGRRA